MATYGKLLVAIGVALAGVAGWLMAENRVFQPAKTETGTLAQFFEEAGVSKLPNATAAMDFTLADVNAGRVRLADLRGKIVFLNFWTTWCPSCRTEMPDMEKLYQKLRDRNFAMVAVSLRETAEVVKRFMESRRLNFTAVLDPDGEVAGRFRIRSIPTTYILNTQGQIMAVALGPRSWNSSAMIALFEQLTGGSMPAGTEGATNR